VTRPLPSGGPPSHLYFLAVVASACLLLHCGTQGPLQPPRLEQPEKVTDLAAHQVGRTLEISFTLPRLATDHERLTKPLEIELLRSAAPSSVPAPASPSLKPWVTLLPDQWSPYAQGDKLSYSIEFSDQEYSQVVGENFAWAVRTLTRGFRHRPHESELSNLIHVSLLEVSVPVEGLRAQTTEKAIELAWTPPARSLTGHPVHDLAGYRMYRSVTGKPGSFTLRGETPTPQYQDREFQFGHTYFYRVRAVFGRNRQTAESEDSLVARITPVDTFPPAAPSGLTAVYSAGAVELVWTANTESDLAGYIVYRREEGGTAQRLNKELLSTPIFRDTAVQAGHKYLYWVTAEDLAHNESSPSPEVAVETN